MTFPSNSERVHQAHVLDSSPGEDEISNTELYQAQEDLKNQTSNRAPVKDQKISEGKPWAHFVAGA